MDLAVTESAAGGSGADGAAADGALVVFVHGVLDQGRSFARVAEHLAPDCRSLWYDRRGYGASADAPGAPVDIGVHIEDLVAVLDGRRAVVVGHSFGGVIAAGAAVRAPENVEALVLYESVMAWAPAWADHTMREILASADPEDAGLRMMLGERYEALGPNGRSRLRGRAEAFIREERSTRGESPPYDIADLRMPVVYGFSETFPVAAMREHLQAAVPDVELVPVPGGGHNAHRAVPEAFAGLVRVGLRRRSARP